MFNRCILLLSLALLYSDAVLAQSTNHLMKPVIANGSIYTTISAGVDFVQMNGDQSLVSLYNYSDYYTGAHRYKASGSVGLGGGLEHEVRPNLLWQLGLAGYFNSAVNAGGHRWEFSLPDFDNFIYRYQVQSSRFMAAGKLLSTYRQRYHPYISGELGASFNRSFGYRENPLLIEEIAMQPFAKNTQTSFSWSVGLGVDVDIRSGLRLGVGYQFADLGKASLGNSPAQETQEALRISHLYDNQARIQLTALI